SDSIPKAVVNSISSYNLVQPTWSTSYSSKKFSLKCDWKLLSSTNSPSTYSTYLPNLTPTIKNLSNDSGYMSHINSQSFLNASTPYHTPYPVHSPRHDVYRPRFKQPVFYPGTPSKQVNHVHQVNTPKNSPQHTFQKPPVDHRPSSVGPSPPSSPKSSNPPDPELPHTSSDTVLSTPDPHDPPISEPSLTPNDSLNSHPSQLSHASPPSNPPEPPNTSSENPLSTPDPNYPPIDPHIPEPSPTLNDSPNSHPSHSPPASPQLPPGVPPVTETLHTLPETFPPNSEFTRIEPPESHPPPADPSDGVAKKPKYKKKKKSHQNKNPPISVTPATLPPPSQIHSVKPTCQSSASKVAENLDTCSVKILSSPHKFVIADCSKDGDITTELTPNTPEFDAQNESFIATPKDLPVNSDGLLPTNLIADRMNIMGKCRLCNTDVESFNADFHLLECRKIDQNDIEDLAFEFADITNNSYYEIVNIIYDYCNYVMHDEDVSYLFPKVSIFAKFLNNIELLLDRKASKVFKKKEISGQQMRFNILNYKL
ncbi:Hypothetical predicted protein, partial [Paramuricea clavata]